MSQLQYIINSRLNRAIFKMSELNDSSSTQKTVKWLKAQQKREERASMFNLIDKKTIQKIQTLHTLNKQITTSKRDIKNLQSKAQQTMKRRTQQTQLYRQRVASLKKMIIQSQKTQKQKSHNHKLKLQQIKSKVEYELKGLKYRQSLSLVDFNQKINNVMNIYTNSLQNLSKNKKITDLRNINAHLKAQLSDKLHLIQKIKQEKDQSLKLLLNEYQSKILEYSKHIISIETQGDEFRSEVVNDVRILQDEIERAMREQLQEREDNKEKILALLEFKAEEIMKKKSFDEKMAV